MCRVALLLTLCKNLVVGSRQNLWPSDRHMKRRILFGLWLLIVTYAFINFLGGTLIAIPLSETVWTFYFHLTGQKNAGIASDLELLTAIAIGFLFSYVFGKF